jgi:ribosomal-protein-alanine N-acetyltransferase
VSVTQTQRLSLRRLTEADADFYCRLVNTPSWIKNIGNRNLPTPAAAAEFIRTRTLPGYEALGFGMYLVESRADGTPLGLAGLVRRDHLPGPDIGFAFLPEHWGKGYALEAARGVVDYARGVLGIGRLLAIVSPHNAPSSRLLEKLGFVLEGKQPVGPDGEELLVYAAEL